MNAVYDPSRARRATSTLGTIALVTLWAVAQGVRVVLFAILALFEPIVRWVLSWSALACFLTCAFYALASPAGLKFPYVLGLSLGTGCAVLLALYEMLVRALEP